MPKMVILNLTIKKYGLYLTIMCITLHIMIIRCSTIDSQRAKRGFRCNASEVVQR